MVISLLNFLLTHLVKRASLTRRHIKFTDALLYIGSPRTESTGNPKDVITSIISSLMILDKIDVQLIRGHI